MELKIYLMKKNIQQSSFNFSMRLDGTGGNLDEPVRVLACCTTIGCDFLYRNHVLQLVAFLRFLYEQWVCFSASEQFAVFVYEGA